MFSDARDVRPAAWPNLRPARYDFHLIEQPTGFDSAAARRADLQRRVPGGGAGAGLARQPPARGGRTAGVGPGAFGAGRAGRRRAWATRRHRALTATARAIASRRSAGSGVGEMRPSR